MAKAEEEEEELKLKGVLEEEDAVVVDAPVAWP